MLRSSNIYACKCDSVLMIYETEVLSNRHIQASNQPEVLHFSSGGKGVLNLIITH